MPTLFERIIAGEIPADIVYEDEHVVAFRDIAPVAPIHVLIVPRTPIPSVDSVEETGDHQHLLNAARKIADMWNLTSGYRLVINTGPDAGQSVNHLHMHLLAGRPLSWPPG